MKITAVGVAAKHVHKAVEFYSLLGFDFEGVNIDEDHVEPKTPKGSARLMIDCTELVENLMGEKPVPSNHSGFAIEYDTPDEVNEAAQKVKNAGFKVVKEPWDAFWGQRYATVEDPDGYKVDLFAYLK